MTNDAAADITDVYAWRSNNGDALNLIMNIRGDFSDDVAYVFHVGNTDDIATSALAYTAGKDIIVTFDSDGNGQLWVGTDDYVAATAADLAGTTVESDAGTKFHAASHADPFYFYLTGFNTARAAAVEAVVSGDVDQFDEHGCPDLSGLHSDQVSFPGMSYGAVLRGVLNGTIDPDPNDGVDTPFNDLAGNDINAIVVQVPLELVGPGPYYQVWGSTNEL